MLGFLSETWKMAGGSLFAGGSIIELADNTLLNIFASPLKDVMLEQSSTVNMFGKSLNCSTGFGTRQDLRCCGIENEAFQSVPKYFCNV